MDQQTQASDLARAHNKAACLLWDLQETAAALSRVPDDIDYDDAEVANLRRIMADTVVLLGRLPANVDLTKITPNPQGWFI